MQANYLGSASCALIVSCFSYNPEIPLMAHHAVTDDLMTATFIVYWKGRQHFCPQSLLLVINSTYIWEAIHDQFVP